MTVLNLPPIQPNLAAAFLEQDIEVPFTTPCSMAHGHVRRSEAELRILRPARHTKKGRRRLPSHATRSLFGKRTDDPPSEIPRVEPRSWAGRPT